VKITFELNGRHVAADVHPGMTLLEFLRGMGLYSVKRGCDHGECGACTVLVDDLALNSCLLLVADLQECRIETLEGLEEKGKVPALQDAFLEVGAVQCGYCTPGMIVSLEALARSTAKPDEEQIRDALSGNLCRCTGYVKPVEAAKVVFKK
jgi:aerobic-type carbon monoxide dehydrogenase small subunit (CoxS/CutS family)